MNLHELFEEENKTGIADPDVSRTLKLIPENVNEDEFQNYKYHPGDDDSSKQMKRDQLYTYLRTKKGLDQGAAKAQMNQILAQEGVGEAGDVNQYRQDADVNADGEALGDINNPGASYEPHVKYYVDWYPKGTQATGRSTETKVRSLTDITQEMLHGLLDVRRRNGESVPRDEILAGMNDEFNEDTNSTIPFSSIKNGFKFYKANNPDLVLVKTGANKFRKHLPRRRGGGAINFKINPDESVIPFTTNEAKGDKMITPADEKMLNKRTAADPDWNKKKEPSNIDREKFRKDIEEGPIDWAGRKLKVKTTKGRPTTKHAPKWANFMAQTPEGAWHWLEQKSVIIGDSDQYFPDAGRTEFSGFVSPPRSWKHSLMPVNTGVEYQPSYEGVNEASGHGQGGTIRYYVDYFPKNAKRGSQPKEFPLGNLKDMPMDVHAGMIKVRDRRGNTVSRDEVLAALNNRGWQQDLPFDDEWTEGVNEAEGDTQATIDRLKKAGGRMFSDRYTKDGQEARLGKNGDVYFLIKPDGTFDRSNDTADFEAQDWVHVEVPKQPKKEKVNHKYLAMKIAEKASESFPDADPWDLLQPEINKIEQVGLDPMQEMDKAANKYLGVKDYHDYLATFYDDASPGEPNPWR